MNEHKEATMASHSAHVAILGCGVIGLSTALAILEGQSDNVRGSKRLVTIVSKEVPDLDYGVQNTGIGSAKKHSAEYASVWAVSIRRLTTRHNGMYMVLTLIRFHFLQGAHHVSDAKSERELRK